MILQFIVVASGVSSFVERKIKWYCCIVYVMGNFKNFNHSNTLLEIAFMQAILLWSLSPYSHTYCHTYCYWYSITHSLFHSRLKSFLFCKSSLTHPFLFLIHVSLYGFPRLFTVTSEHIRLFTFYFFCFYTFLVVGSVSAFERTLSRIVS